MTNRYRENSPYDDEDGDEGSRSSGSSYPQSRGQRGEYGYGREGSSYRSYESLEPRESSGRWSGPRSQRPWARGEEGPMDYESESQGWNAPRGEYGSEGRSQYGSGQPGYRGPQSYGRRGNYSQLPQGQDSGSGGFGRPAYGQQGYGQQPYGPQGFGPQIHTEQGYGYGRGESVREGSGYGGESGRSGYESRTRRTGNWGKGPKGYRRSDERLKEEVSECLTQDPQIDASEIEVEVANGIVTLKGTIDSRETKWRLESLCDEISGVRDVQNQVRIQRNEERTTSTGDGNRTSSSRSSNSESAYGQKTSGSTSSDRSGSNKSLSAGS